MSLDASTSDPVVVSCPGKVLLAGGYLVLDRAHQGFVISTPSRFYTVVQPLETPSDGFDRVRGQARDGRVRLSVRSPQFDDGKWEYDAVERDGEWTVEPVESQSSSNSFVHLSLQATLQVASVYAQPPKLDNLLITIVGSNDFYSQSREDSSIPVPFAPLNCTIRNVHKTGLGSSAAMVTSLTSALFLYWTSRLKSTGSSQVQPVQKQLMHNLAQYVHSLAQGKIGSGFDVSAAVYGSQVYRRFDVKCLGNLLDAASEQKASSRSLLSALSPSENALWTSSASAAETAPFSLPPYMTLVLADVDAGSNTPSMVGKVMRWKAADPTEARRVWDELRRSNESLRDDFMRLRQAFESGKEEYLDEVKRLAKLPVAKWPENTTLPFAAAAQHILRTRALMREMGERSDVPIEPEEQTRLLDECSRVEGVVGAGVPGAGGYDAIWVLCLSPPSDASKDSRPTPPATSSGPVSKIDALLRSYRQMSVRPLSDTAWAVGSTGDERGDYRKGKGEVGLVRETIDDVEGLRDAVARAKKQ
ncbi:hypothetical protein JCM10212_004557 [Sporobolomyces blumeae]